MDKWGKVVRKPSKTIKQIDANQLPPLLIFQENTKENHQKEKISKENEEKTNIKEDIKKEKVIEITTIKDEKMKEDRHIGKIEEISKKNYEKSNDTKKDDKPELKDILIKEENNKVFRMRKSNNIDYNLKLSKS